MAPTNLTSRQIHLAAHSDDWRTAAELHDRVSAANECAAAIRLDVRTLCAIALGRVAPDECPTVDALAARVVRICGFDVDYADKAETEREEDLVRQIARIVGIPAYTIWNTVFHSDPEDPMWDAAQALLPPN